MTGNVGILAFGSVITDPGEEIAEATIRTKNKVLTPFNVEFARKSKGRAGAPTLVPVNKDGAPVLATLLILNVTEQEAMDRLYRREINKIGQKKFVYTPKRKPTADTLIIDRWVNVEGVPVVISAKFGANIDPLTPVELAAAAIRSAQSPFNVSRDGISYLIDAKNAGIVTPLSPLYEEEIKKQTGTTSLDLALAQAQAKARRSLDHVIRAIASVIWNIHLKRVTRAVDADPRLNFWRLIYGNFMDMAVIEWCKLFGSDHEGHQPLHWKNVIPLQDHDDFRVRLLADLNLSLDDWRKYRDGMKDYRDNQAAHFSAAWLETAGQHYPELELGLKATYFYYADVIARLGATGVAHRYPEDVQDYAQRYATQAAEAATKAIAATANMEETVR